MTSVSEATSVALHYLSAALLIPTASTVGQLCQVSFSGLGS